jgi:hypothetical protein
MLTTKVTDLQLRNDIMAEMIERLETSQTTNPSLGLHQELAHCVNDSLFYCLTGLKKGSVPAGKESWSVLFEDYQPVEFTSTSSPSSGLFSPDVCSLRHSTH